MASHAAYPSPLKIAPDRLRIFLVARDSENRGNVGYVDIDPDDPLSCRDVSQKPCLDPGPEPAFHIEHR